MNNGLIVFGDRGKPGAKFHCDICLLPLEEKYQETVKYDFRYPGYYYYECPNYTQAWHRHVTLLFKERDNTNSIVLRRLLEFEINTTLLNKKKPAHCILPKDISVKFN